MRMFQLILCAIAVVSFHTLTAQHNPSLDQLKQSRIPIVAVHVQENQAILTKEYYLRAGITFHDLVNNQYVAYNDSTEIRGRGNSSWELYPKKSYRLKLLKSRSVLSMPANRHWALIANFIDRSLVRNISAFGISRYFGLAYAPRTKLVHLLINDQYYGIHQFTEVIKVGKDRINIAGISEKNGVVSGGVILEVDDRLDEQYHFTTQIAGVNLTVKDPDDLDSKDAGEAERKFNYVRKIVQDAENALFSSNYRDSETGYKKHFNVASLVDWYLTEELYKNVDAEFRFSVYMYIDTKNDNKLTMGPVWDFDISSGTLNNDATDYYIRKYEGKWFARLFSDPAFEQAVKNAWKEKREGLFDALIENINKQSREVYHAQKENFSRWKREDYRFELPYYYSSNYLKEVLYLKQWLKTRIEWLDGQFLENPTGLNPLTTDQYIAINEDASVNLTLEGFGKRNDQAQFRINNPRNGFSYQLNPQDGKLLYQPAKDYFGKDTISYQYFDGVHWSDTGKIFIDIAPVNDRPVIQVYTDTIDEDMILVVDEQKGLQYSTIDPDNQAHSFEITRNPKHGELIIQSGGAFSYRPKADYSGTDTFYFKASDPYLSAEEGYRIIKIMPVNDAPVLKSLQISMNEDGDIKLSVKDLTKKMVMDIDDSLHQFNVIKQPIHGTLTLQNDALQYKPEPDYFGIDTVWLIAKDTALFSNENFLAFIINPVNDAPVLKSQQATLNEDEDVRLSIKEMAKKIVVDVDDTLHQLQVTKQPIHGTLTLQNDTLRYKPEPNYFGSDSVWMIAKDTALFSNENFLAFNIKSVNDAPVAQKDLFVQTSYNSPLVLNKQQVLDAVKDVDGDPLNLVCPDNSNKQYQINCGEQIILTPEPGFYGVIDLKISCVDPDLASATVNIKVRVLPPKNTAGFESIRIYPNPSSGTMKIDELQIDLIMVYDQAGRMVKRQKISVAENDAFIDLRPIVPGSYQLVLYAEGKFIATKKLVIY